MTAHLEVLIPEKRDRFELRSLFDEWLKRRLREPRSDHGSTTSQLDPKHTGRVRDLYPEKTLVSLKARFEQDPSLFEKVFEVLANEPNEERSFWLFVVHDVRQLLPATVWPVPQCQFFLALAEKENDPERGSRILPYVSVLLPSEGASVALAEAGCNAGSPTGSGEDTRKLEDLQDRRMAKGSVGETSKGDLELSEARAQNITYFTPASQPFEKEARNAILWAAGSI